MTITYKVLGQINPAANTTSTIYTVPAATSVVISTVAICNLSSTATSFTLAVQPAAATLAAKHYLNYNTPLPPNDTITLTMGITMATTDILTGSSTSSQVSFSVFGSEIS